MARSLILACVLLAACATEQAPEAVQPPEPSGRDVLLGAAALELAEQGTPRSEEVLAAAGADAVPWLRRILESGDVDARRRARALLIAAGEDLQLSPEEEIDQILFDLTREEQHPYASLKALERLRALGPQAVEPLRRASVGEDRRARVARRLLDRLPGVQ